MPRINTKTVSAVEVEECGERSQSSALACSVRHWDRIVVYGEYDDHIAEYCALCERYGTCMGCPLDDSEDNCNKSGSTWFWHHKDRKFRTALAMANALRRLAGKPEISADDVARARKKEGVTLVDHIPFLKDNIDG